MGSHMSNHRNCCRERERECERENEQRHVHEVQGSVFIAEPEEEPHNHRFATVSGEAIPCGEHDHVHEVKFRTDFFNDHFHEFCGKTGGAIRVGDRHVHFLKDFTTVVDGHRHEFRFNTFIDNPIGEEHKKSKHNYRYDME
ncbi:YmaF family protein [Anaerocolumna aminovalerica]|uniref:YmaF family protein n=1 Tax=Anaerocolumna aminovalerica TaxID=1527 RepID=UPI002E8E4656|nr:YmaF family protein [Anaerocolumna aminovalerica]